MRRVLHLRRTVGAVAPSRCDPHTYERVQGHRVLASVAVAGGVAVWGMSNAQADSELGKQENGLTTLDTVKTSPFAVVGSGLSAMAAVREMLKSGVEPHDITVIGEEVQFALFYITDTGHN